MIVGQAQTGGADLIGWSWLYHRYVRVELNLTPDRFCDAAHIDARTLRRYQQRTIRQLTHKLIQAEWEARQSQRHRRLLAQFPFEMPDKLFGRADDLWRLENLLNDSTTKHFLIIGPAGIGKSTLIQALLRVQVEHNAIDYLLWLDTPASIDFVKQSLIEKLLPSNAMSISLKEFLLINRVVLVLDNVHLLGDSLTDLQRLLDELHYTPVFLINRDFFALTNCVHVFVRGLNQSDSFELARHVLATDQNEDILGQDSIREMASAIWERGGGNPLAIKLTAHNLPYLDIELASERSLDLLYSQVYTDMNKSLQQAWLTLCLIPQEGLSIASLQKLWPDQIMVRMLVELAKKHLIEYSHTPVPKISLAASARQYIQKLYCSDGHAKAVVDDLVQDLYRKNDNDTFTAPIEVVEVVLTSNWLNISSFVWSQWVAKSWNQGIKKNHLALWRALLGSYIAWNPSDLRAKIGYGICMRSLAECNSAQAILREVIAESGQKGMFFDQATAALELAVTCRLCGDYHNAHQWADAAAKIVTYHGTSELKDVINLELAQAAIDADNYKSAQAILTHLPKTSFTLYLWSQVYLLAGRFDLCREFAHEALEISENNEDMRGHLHTLIGRSYIQQGNFQRARQHLTTAVTLLEQQHEVSLLARGWSNLGALCVQLKVYQEAKILLQKAKGVQQCLSDKVAYAATEHNLALLAAMFAG
jgi:tetratricopeptide (TPR) repeat protein